MYVDPLREIYKILGMKRGEGNKASGKHNFLTLFRLSQTKQKCSDKIVWSQSRETELPTGLSLVGYILWKRW